jgi:hypothetical protein
MNEIRPSRAAVAHVYLKRALRWRRNNWPYISGDCFADLADYVHNAPRFRGGFGKIENARIIFCRSHELEELFDRYSHLIQARVVITGNSDYEFHVVPRNIPGTVRALFLQNSYVSDDKSVFSIPIGVENFRLGVNGNPRFFRARNEDQEVKQKVLVGPLSPTHPVREQMLENLTEESPYIDVYTGRLKPHEYDALAKDYAAVAAVRGNGIDTHRLWESLYRGIPPIVQEDLWWKGLSHHFPEVTAIGDWTLNQVSEPVSNKGLPFFKPHLIEALWMPYWKNLIDSFVD